MYFVVYSENLKMIELNNTQVFCEYCHYNEKWLVTFAELFAIEDIIHFGIMRKTIQEGLTDVEKIIDNAQTREELIELSNNFENWEDNSILLFNPYVRDFFHLTEKHLTHWITLGDDESELWIQSSYADPDDRDECIFGTKIIIPNNSSIDFWLDGISRNNMKLELWKSNNLIKKN